MNDELKRLAQFFPKDKPLYAVGGCVRDKLMGREGGDIDISSACRIEEVADIVKKAGMSYSEGSKRLGTVIIKGQWHYEYTAFRVDSYPDGSGTHTPVDVRFTDDMSEDARRRDFTVNALYYDICNDSIVDLLGGRADIESRVLKAVDNPYRVLSEDGLRIMRLYRFVSTLGFAVEDETAKASSELSGRLKDIAPERIRDELIKTLEGDNAVVALRGLYTCGAMEVILPELAANGGVEQNAKYHKYDVLEHSFAAVGYAPKRVRLAALLHDVGKGKCMRRDGNMYKHDQVSACIAADILKRLRFPKSEIERTCRLIASHMRDMDGKTRENKMRKFIAANSDIVDDLTDLMYADAMATGYGADKQKCYRMRRIRDQMVDSGIPMSLSQLAVDGQDLIAMGYSGKEIGETLQSLLDMCIYKIKRNDKEELLDMLNRRRDRQ
ncbi:MAG: HD domain-containing protein [Clostridia bacterium]|nr:HD domain-containing protein [Clostridia bacterium]